MLGDDDKARAILADFRSAPLTPRERAIVTYAVKLTERPKEMTADDVEALRGAGLGDDEILDVCQVTAYYNFANRLVDGLGVELEDYWDK